MNWIILENIDNDLCNGINRFVQQIVYGLAKNSNTNVIVIGLGKINSFEFTLEKRDNVTYYRIPVPVNFTNTLQNHRKLGKSILHLIIKYLSPSYETIVHLNDVNQFFIAHEIIKHLSCKAIITQHYINPNKQQYDAGMDINKLTYNLVSNVIAISEHLKIQLYNNNNMSPEKIHLIQNGIRVDVTKQNFKNVDLLEKYGIDKSEKIILYHRMADDTKGLEIFVKAIATLLNRKLNWRIVTIGNYNLENLMIATRSFSSKISFLGCISDDDIISLYHISYMGIFLSQEEYCNSIALEMLHCGLPVVAFNINGLNEVFQHGNSAFLVDITQSDSKPNLVSGNLSIAESIERLLTDEELRNTFSRNSKLRAKELFTNDIMVKKYLQLAQVLLTP